VARPRIAVTTSPAEPDPRYAGVRRAYVDSVVAAGGVPVLLPILDPIHAPIALEGIDGLLLSGGGDVDPARYGAAAHPEVYGVDADRDAWELALVAASTVPVLGICRGTQVLNVAAGGTLVQHLPDRTEVRHRDREREAELVHAVEVVPGSRLHAVVGGLTIGVNSLHHQAIDQVAAGFAVVARAGDGTVEAIEAQSDRPVLGVQWHPELLGEHEAQRAIFTWLVAAAGASKAHVADPSVLMVEAPLG
jgi:putative glutamine amidotransferase